MKKIFSLIAIVLAMPVTAQEETPLSATKAYHWKSEDLPTS